MKLLNSIIAVFFALYAIVCFLKQDMDAARYGVIICLLYYILIKVEK